MHRREEDGIPDPGIMPTSSSIRIQAQPQPMMMSTSSIGGGSVPMTCCSANINKHQFSNVFLVGYLGSAILTKGKTGLGCLQQPLRELYYIYRQNGARLLQERRVFISMDGITMIYNEYGVEKFLHNDLSSVYDIQLLQLICEQRKDKKLHCAFLPIDHEPDICYTNLFHPVDKQSTRLIENTAHPAIIALIMRRSVGIQALECHVLITRVLNDSIRIVNEVRNVCARHKYDLNQRANLFQYRPAVITSTAAIAEQQRAAAAQLQQQQQQNNKPPVYHKPSPFSRLQKRNSSRDGPYDAFGSQSSASRLAAGGAMTDSRSNLQAQQLNRNVPPSPSLFSKIKSNLIDKSKSSAGDNKKQEKIKEPKPSKSNSKSRQKLTSASAINFPSCGDGPNGALDGRDSHRLPSIRPSSALAAPLVNITFSSKPKSKNKQQQNGLKQQSMSSLGHNVEADAQSIKSSGSSKKDKSTSSSSSSKLSLGKRLLLSARSSLKSNSSSLSGNDSVNKSKMMSNSTTSLNAAASASPSRSRGGGDVDFRSKSRTSIVANENTNPIVDCNGCNGNGAYGGYGVIQDSNFILKSRSPARVVLNRGPSMSPCCQSRRPSQTNTTTTAISQQSPAAASVLRNPSQTPSITSSTSHLSRRGVCELHPHASPLLPTRSDYYETTECETEDDNDRTKTRVIRYQKRNFKYPLMGDPKLLANHLAWNRSSRSAECLDESLTIDEAHRHQQQVNRPVAVSPVARAVSPGFALLQQQQQQQQQVPQKAIITTTTSNCMGAPCRSRSYTTNQQQQQQPQSTSQQVTATTTIDSAYSTQSSNEDSSDSKPAPCNSGGSSSNGCNHACCKRCADAAAAASGSNISVMERLRHEQEQDEANRMVKKSNSHKIVGGVKVFPTLPHEHRHAAESRRQRLDDIERNLSRIEKNSWEMRQRSSDSNGANEEVIDLTRQQQQQQQQRQQNDEQSTQNSQRIQFKSTTEIPIEISSRQREPNIRLKNTVDYVQSKASHVANSTNNNNSSYGRNSNNNNNNNAADKLSNSNNKLNYIYYFDNDHFGGY